MKLYEVPGELVVGSLRQSVFELMHHGVPKAPISMIMSDYNRIIICQSKIESSGNARVVGILPVKQKDGCSTIPFVKARNCLCGGLSVVLDEMINFLLTENDAEKKICYASSETVEWIVTSFEKNGFVLEQRPDEETRCWVKFKT
tara:strand:- start:9359 stop:9793 length:435 start_codon:yes stop_codon:yes gene_type:complete